MYNFKKVKNEKIGLIEDDCKLLFEGKERSISIILTDKRLILLDCIVDDIKEVLRISKGAKYIKAKEEFFSINIIDIEKVIEGNFDKYLLNNGSFFFLKSKELKKYLK